MQATPKKQFSLSMLVRVFLAIIVVVSLVVFANSVMRYNQLKEEEAELEALVAELTLLKEELTELVGSSEELSRTSSESNTPMECIQNTPDLAQTGMPSSSAKTLCSSSSPTPIIEAMIFAAS